MIIIGALFILLSGVAEAIMDKLQFHFHESVFSNMKSTNWWNPYKSWKNKWKNGDKSQGEKFLFSSTLFVFTTDAWHFFKFVRNLLLFTCWIPVIFLLDSIWHTLLTVALYRILYGVGFYFTYNKFTVK